MNTIYFLVQPAQPVLQTLISWFWFIGQGTLVTLKYSVISAVIGCLIATLFVASNFRWGAIFAKITNIYVSVIRGTPLLLQLSLIYFALPPLLGAKISLFAAGIISFSVNSSAYIYEIFRSGINAIPKGEIEAAKTLGLPDNKILRKIIMPQAIKNVLPALLGEIINLVKETAVISVLGEEDIMRRASMISAQKYDYLTPLIFAGIWYYLIITLLEIIVKRITSKQPLTHQ